MLKRRATTAAGHKNPHAMIQTLLRCAAVYSGYAPEAGLGGEARQIDYLFGAIKPIGA